MIGDSRLVFVEIFKSSLNLNIFARDTRNAKSYQRAQPNPSSAIAPYDLSVGHVRELASPRVSLQIKKWAILDSNQRPHACDACALAN